MFEILFSILLFSAVFQGAKANFENLKKDLHVDKRFIADPIIRQLFEMFKDVIKNGRDENGIPVLDPYKFDSFEVIKVQFDEPGEGMSYGAIKLSNGTLSGLGDYHLRSFTFTKSDISIEMDMHFPEIHLMSDFEIDGKLAEILPMLQNGILKLEVKNITIKGKTFWKQSDDQKSILLSHFEEMGFKIESIWSGINFDNNIDTIINAMIRDLLGDYLSKFSRTIYKKYGYHVIRAINPILNKLESWYIIAAILKNNR